MLQMSAPWSVRYCASRHPGEHILAKEQCADGCLGSRNCTQCRCRACPACMCYDPLGRLLQRELGHPIGLLQVSLGASALGVWEEGAALSTMMVECTAAAGCGGLRGVLWYQGEAVPPQSTALSAISMSNIE